MVCKVISLTFNNHNVLEAVTNTLKQRFIDPERLKKRFKMLTTSMSQITVTNQTIQSTANAHRGTHLKIPWALLKVRFMELTMDCCFS